MLTSRFEVLFRLAVSVEVPGLLSDMLVVWDVEVRLLFAILAPISQNRQFCGAAKVVSRVDVKR